MPDSSIDIFNDRMTDILNKVNKDNELLYMLGDLNIDLLKCEKHRLTSSFVDILYSNNLFPLITKPTRVTQTTATLIDHVLTNNFDIYWENIDKVYYVPIYRTIMLYFIMLAILCVNQ